jgi:hypothetical protein
MAVAGLVLMIDPRQSTSVAAAWLQFGERPTSLEWSGMICVVGALVLTASPLHTVAVCIACNPDFQAAFRVLPLRPRRHARRSARDVEGHHGVGDHVRGPRLSGISPCHSHMMRSELHCVDKKYGFAESLAKQKGSRIVASGSWRSSAG